MKLFGRKSGGASARPALLRAPWARVTIGEWPRGYKAQVRAAYMENAIAQRAVRLVSEGVGSAPLAGEAGDVALVTAASAGQPLLETVAAHLLLHGNAFLQIVCDAEGAPAELYALRPERVTIEPDATGWPAAYLYRVGEKTARIEAAEPGSRSAPAGPGHPTIIHIRAMHPLDDHYGLGTLGAAAGAVAIHNAASRWNKALLDNAARPSGALVYDPGEPGRRCRASSSTG